MRGLRYINPETGNLEEIDMTGVWGPDGVTTDETAPWWEEFEPDQQAMAFTVVEETPVPEPSRRPVWSWRLDREVREDYVLLTVVEERVA